MREWQSQSHVRWYCRYHVVWVPKYRKRAIFGEMRRGVGRIVRELCQRHGVELVEGHALSDRAGQHDVVHYGRSGRFERYASADRRPRSSRRRLDDCGYGNGFSLLYWISREHLRLRASPYDPLVVS